MKIIIEGNMASGKSLYARLVAKSTKLEQMSMDMARREVWNSKITTPVKRESEARNRVFKWLALRPSFVYERIGTGRFDERIDELFSVSIPFKILIKAKPSTCIKRFEEREASASQRLILPDYMNDPEGFIYRTAEVIDAKERRGDYDFVIENDAVKDASILKREILEIRSKVAGRMAV